MTRKLLAVLALLGLHGCNTVEDPLLDTMTNRETHTSTGNRELPVHLASASLAGLREAPLSLRQPSHFEAMSRIPPVGERVAISLHPQDTIIVPKAAR